MRKLLRNIQIEIGWLFDQYPNLFMGTVLALAVAVAIGGGIAAERYESLGLVILILGGIAALFPFALFAIAAFVDWRQGKMTLLQAIGAAAFVIALVAFLVWRGWSDE